MPFERLGAIIDALLQLRNTTPPGPIRDALNESINGLASLLERLVVQAERDGYRDTIVPMRGRGFA